MSSNIKVAWVGNGRKAQCSPNPEYPEGVEVDISAGAKASCRVDLPYPAPECGVWTIKCEDCGLFTAVTAAGRPDDPISLRVPCRPLLQ